MIGHEYKRIPRGVIPSGAVGYLHLIEVLEFIKFLKRINRCDNNYSPKPFMVTASTNAASVEVNRNSILKKHNTEVLHKGDISCLRNYVSDYPLPLEKDTSFTIFLREHCGQEVMPTIVSYDKNKKQENKGVGNCGGVLSSYDLRDDKDYIKSLLPNITDGEENKTHRVDCLKSNNMPINGYAAFNAEDVDKLRKEGKDPILFIQDYDIKRHTPILDKVAGVVCLGIGGSHLLDKGIPTISESSQEIWNKKTGEWINYSRIEKVDSKPAVINNSHAIKRAVYNWKLKGSDINNPPKPEYYNPQKNKIVLFKAGDEVTLARTAAYQGHLKIEYPDVTHVVKEVRDISSQLPFKHPRFLATMNSATDSRQGDKGWVEAAQLGAEGVGLIRTEYMYNNEILENIKEGILKNDSSKFSHLGAYRHNGLNGTFYDAKDKFANNETLRIRLFDFPPDEFFTKEELKILRDRVGDDIRGTPLALATNGLYESQLNNIFSYVKDENADLTQPINLQIMAPHIRNAGEMEKFKEMVENVARENDFPRGHYQIGAMMETKTACDPAEAAKIAKLCDFMSFGTNDLTEEITGIKRPFEGDSKSPYDVLRDDVKTVMKSTAKAVREANPNITIGCCGGQMKDSDSLMFCAKDLQLDDVSVPPDALHLLGRRLQLLQAIEREHIGAASAKVGNVSNFQKNTEQKVTK